ncbi:MAG: hypothetical protein ACOYN5_16295 [Bacteroidales bacterium]
MIYEEARWPGQAASRRADEFQNGRKSVEGIPTLSGMIVSSLWTRHYFDWIFAILKERAGASPDQRVLVLLPIKRTKKQ